MDSSKVIIATTFALAVFFYERGEKINFGNKDTELSEETAIESVVYGSPVGICYSPQVGVCYIALNAPVIAGIKFIK